MRERGDVEARLLARQVPPDARVVALVFPADAADRAARAADAVAAGVARRREHTLLASCEAADGALDALLGAADSSGLAAALRGDARLTDVAVRREDRPYVYLPAGRRPPEPSHLLTDPAFRAFVARARDRGGSLLLFLPEALISLPEVADLLDGYVALGAVRALPAGPVPALARLVFDVEDPEPLGAPEVLDGGEDPERRQDGASRSYEGAGEEGPALGGEAVSAADPALADGRPAGTGEHALADGPAGTGEHALADGPAGEDGSEAETTAYLGPELREAAEGEPPESVEPVDAEGATRRPGTWSRHRERARIPLVRIAAGALVIALLVGAWWVFAREATSPAPFGEEAAAEPALEEPTPAEARSLLAAVDAAPELPYSVLIASYADAQDARDRLARLRRSDAGLYFVAPTPVRGAIYHRVFAGARADAGAGRALMEELVETGRKESASAWDVRPAGLSYRLGIYRTEEMATEASRRLEEAGVLAYVLPAGMDGERAWQVYAGGYESEAAARPMAAVLERAGRRAELVMRRGEAR